MLESVWVGVASSAATLMTTPFLLIAYVCKVDSCATTSASVVKV